MLALLHFDDSFLDLFSQAMKDDKDEKWWW